MKPGKTKKTPDGIQMLKRSGEKSNAGGAKLKKTRHGKGERKNKNMTLKRGRRGGNTEKLSNSTCLREKKSAVREGKEKKKERGRPKKENEKS